jgi:hypothetical protein
MPDLKRAALEWRKLSTNGEATGDGNAVREPLIEGDENCGGRVRECRDDNGVTSVVAQNRNWKRGDDLPRARRR